MTVAAAVIVAAQHERDRKIDLFLAKGLLLSATAGPFLAVVASRVVNRSYQTYDANGVALAVGTGNASQLTILRGRRGRGRRPSRRRARAAR